MPNMPKPKKMKTRHQITAVIINEKKVSLLLIISVSVRQEADIFNATVLRCSR